MLGLGTPLLDTLALQNNQKKTSFSGNVVIVGAGAAGLSAGYLLKKQGIDFTILEARKVHGGRMKTNNDFADFPIPLGAEWTVANTGYMDQLVGNKTVSSKINTIGYTQNETYGVWYNNKLIFGDLGTLNYRKFLKSSWLDIFEKYITPTLAEHIRYETPVTSIDYSDSPIGIKTKSSEFKADRVIITTPLPLLQNKKIQFRPQLPKKKLNAINNLVVWDGFKAFIEFKEKFYPAFVDVLIHPKTDGQLSYYDASYGQKTNKNILGLFSVGKPAKKYSQLTDLELKNYMLNKLDKIFDGKATSNYVKHIKQDWSKEPYAGGAYINDHANPKTVATVKESVDEKLFFAGDCYTDGNDWGNVHNAIESAQQCVQKILENYS